jgi:hypothetical protein
LLGFQHSSWLHIDFGFYLCLSNLYPPPFVEIPPFGWRKPHFCRSKFPYCRSNSCEITSFVSYRLFSPDPRSGSPVVHGARWGMMRWIRRPTRNMLSKAVDSGRWLETGKMRKWDPRTLTFLYGWVP